MKEKNGVPLSDGEFSARMGRYQRWEKLCALGMAIGVLGFVFFIVLYRNPASVAFAGVFVLCFFIRMGAKRHRRALLYDRLGGFFTGEEERFFGPAPEVPTLPIDTETLTALGVVRRQWEQCRVSAFYEGVYRGMRFSAANVTFLHVYERSFGPDGKVACEDEVLRGLVLRCAPLAGSGSAAPSGLLDAADALAHAAPGDDVPPGLLNLLGEMQRAVPGKLVGAAAGEGVLTVVLRTDYLFADVPMETDMRDIDGVRQQFTASLERMEYILDTMLDTGPAAVGEKREER